MYRFRAVRSLAVLVVPLLALVLAHGASALPSGVSVSVETGVVQPGDGVIVHVRGAAPRRPLRLYLRAYPTASEPPIQVGSARANGEGRTQLHFRLPRLDAAVYRPWVRVGKRLIAGHGLLSVAAVQPYGFGALGTPGCAPASPSRGRDIFGTAVGAQLWALPFAASGDAGAATFTGVVGKDTKIVFKMTSGIPLVFYAVAPDGTRVAPAWTTPHDSSNWNRPGAEWGAGFVFNETGCWRIHAGTTPSSGDIWLSILS